MLENRKWQKDWQVQVRGTQKDKKNYKKTKSDKKWQKAHPGTSRGSEWTWPASTVQLILLQTCHGCHHHHHWHHHHHQSKSSPKNWSFSFESTTGVNWAQTQSKDATTSDKRFLTRLFSVKWEITVDQTKLISLVTPLHCCNFWLFFLLNCERESGKRKLFRCPLNILSICIIYMYNIHCICHPHHHHHWHHYHHCNDHRHCNDHHHHHCNDDQVHIRSQGLPNLGNSNQSCDGKNLPAALLLFKVEKSDLSCNYLDYLDYLVTYLVAVTFLQLSGSLLPGWTCQRKTRQSSNVWLQSWYL